VTLTRITHESHLSRFSSCSQLNRNNILQLFHLVLHVSDSRVTCYVEWYSGDKQRNFLQ